MRYDDLDGFWAWAGITPEAYAAGTAGEVEEYFYPRWQEVLDNTRRMLDGRDSSAAALDRILTALALDNETEDILDYISEADLPRGYIDAIAAAGCRHLQPHARWQVAELLRRRPVTNAAGLLRVLSGDGDGYVRRRAENSLLALRQEGK